LTTLIEQAVVHPSGPVASAVLALAEQRPVSAAGLYSGAVAVSKRDRKRLYLVFSVPMACMKPAWACMPRGVVPKRIRAGLRIIDWIQAAPSLRGACVTWSNISLTGIATRSQADGIAPTLRGVAGIGVDPVDRVLERLHRRGMELLVRITESGGCTGEQRRLAVRVRQADGQRVQPEA
jgi:hypothetical protein